MTWMQPVRDGEPKDVCPLCGIWRQHAGNPDSCGTQHYLMPGCFIEPPAVSLVVGDEEEA